MKLNKNNPYIDGRKTNGGFRIGAGRKKKNVDAKYISLPILVPLNAKFDIVEFRTMMRNVASQYFKIFDKI